MNEMGLIEKGKSQSGQAVVEYILLVAIAVMLILGLAQQFYKPFGNWMNDYMGQYLECLLDRGELPTLSGGAPEGGECASRFEPFTPTGGRRPIDPNGRPKPGDDDPRSTTSASASSSSGSGSSGGGASSSSRSRSRSFTTGKGGGADAGGSETGENQFTEKLPESNYFRFRNNRSSASQSNESRQQSGQTFSVPLKNPRAKAGSDKTIRVQSDLDSSESRPNKKFVVTPTPRKIANDEKEFEWSFGQYFKMALIILIIIAIVLFLGGQILQITKSMEK